MKKSQKSQLKTDLPAFRPGDTVRVHVKVVEGTRERIQVFEGVVIKRRGGGISETFTVRKVSYGVGVERTFPLHTPRIAEIQVMRRGKVRRAKLYYLRNLRGKKSTYQRNSIMTLWELVCTSSLFFRYGLYTPPMEEKNIWRRKKKPNVGMDQSDCCSRCACSCHSSLPLCADF
ncbi:hypothetical protein GCM10020331_047780 [Ectobacillus funiculus]